MKIVRPEIWGHRGARGLAPENTLPAFKLAAKLGVDGVELDVHLTKDGEVVVIHDDRVDRTTNGSGYVKDITFEELSKLDAGSKFGSQWSGTRVPRLREVLSNLKDCKFKVELKHGSTVYEGIEEKVLEEVKKFSRLDKVEFTSFDFDALQRLRELEARASLGLIFIGRPRWFLDVAKRLEATSLNSNISLVTKEDVKVSNQEGFRLGLWTVNEEWEMKKAWELCPDSITTDYPDKALRERRECSP
ncbi:glycerophosphoryl diester phosphodiesterase [Sulfodiicoccus acidiphilus]|nr:glycerophosphoryl diester phosphodiesterase [Sulfodiicoccus acidiphilus]